MVSDSVSLGAVRLSSYLGAFERVDSSKFLTPNNQMYAIFSYC